MKIMATSGVKFHLARVPLL